MHANTNHLLNVWLHGRIAGIDTLSGCKGINTLALPWMMITRSFVCLVDNMSFVATITFGTSIKIESIAETENEAILKLCERFAIEYDRWLNRLCPEDSGWPEFRAMCHQLAVKY